jgi:hypothetical protein
MAAIFQIKRGSDSVSLVDGELYLHKTSGSLQIGSGSSVVTLAKLNEQNIGNFNVTGDITIGGTITIGDSTSDSVIFNADLSSSIIPDATNTYDLGASNKIYRNIYGNAVWGAISASNGVISGSAQFTSVLSSLNDFTSSQNTKNSTLQTYTASIDTKFTTLQSLTASNSNRLSRLEESTSSLNQFSASVNGHISDINIKTGSFENKLIAIGASTSSLNTFSASVNGHISDINTKTGSLETKWATLQNVTSSILSYTSSLKSAIELTGSSVTILGNLVVKGTQLLVDSTTIQLGDNILELNGTAAANGGLLVKDTTGTSGSLLWDSTNDYWKGGTIGNEEKLLRAGSDSVISGSLTSLNTFSASVNGHISDINTKTGSFETKFVTLGLYTASLDVKNTTLQTLTASMQAQVARLQESTASLNLYTASQETKNSTLATYTASVSGHITDINTKTGSFENKFTILQNVTASFNTATASLNTFSASINGHVTDINIWTASVNTKFTTLQSVTASLNSATASLFISSSQLTASLTQLRSDFATLQTSVDPNSISGHLTDINAWTASVKGHIVDINIKTGSFEAKFSTLQTYTASINGHVADINTWSASVKGHIVDINSKTGSYETTGRGIISGSSQISSLLPSGVVSGSAQISGSIFNTITGDVLITSNGLATIQANSVALGVDTTGNYMSDLTQGTGVTISHTPGEGSNATISIAQAVATTSNVQFGSIGVGTTASGASGEIRATGDITAYYSSDERLKENIQPIVNALSKVESINGNTYDWKEGFEEIHSHKGSDLGVIAQEVQSVLPDVVKERDNGYLAVDYIKLVPVLIEAIKELSAKVKELENK